MSRILKAALPVLVIMLCLAPVTQAAPEASLKIAVEIMDDTKFWNCSFFTKDGTPVKPTAVKVDWSIGNLGKNEKVQTIILPGKSSGQASIVTEKGALVNIGVSIRGPKNEYLGSWSSQTLNNGQTETIVITPPESVLPEITRSNI
ncbi:MAG: hypothetical protein N2491_01365 [Negativicutes bacterium]|nr:hypothetical protein [Negativicutes bacterium]